MNGTRRYTVEIKDANGDNQDLRKRKRTTESPSLNFRGDVGCRMKTRSPPKGRPIRPKISAAKQSALRLMRKLKAATGGRAAASPHVEDGADGRVRHRRS